MTQSASSDLTRRHALELVFASSETLAGGAPLLVMDMHERAYIQAFFQNVKWDEVNRRAEAARKMAP